jgi:hypothetical protein
MKTSESQYLRGYISVAEMSCSDSPLRTLRLPIREPNGEPKREPTAADAERCQAMSRDNRAGQMAYQATLSDAPRRQNFT